MLNKTFKLQSRTIKYVTNVEEKKVTAICEFDSVLGTVKATGYAVCGDSDKFNKAKGRKLARARAELNAYATYRQRLFDYQCSLNEKFNDTCDKLFDYIEHQIEYINAIK